MNWWSKRYFVTLLFPLFHSCMLLQIRLHWNKLIQNGARNINSSYLDNKGKRITCTSLEKTNSRQLIIVNKIIIPITVVYFPNELNQNGSQYPNWSRIYKLPNLSLLLNLLPAFHTLFYSLVPLNQLLSLACAKISPVYNFCCVSTNRFNPLSLFSLCATSIFTQPIRSYLKQTNLNLLSKHCNLPLKSAHSVGGLCNPAVSIGGWNYQQSKTLEKLN